MGLGVDNWARLCYDVTATVSWRLYMGVMGFDRVPIDESTKSSIRGGV